MKKITIKTSPEIAKAFSATEFSAYAKQTLRAGCEPPAISKKINRGVSHQQKGTISFLGCEPPAIIAVKFRREEIEAIDAECQRNGRMSRAAWIRAAAHKALQSA